MPIERLSKEEFAGALHRGQGRAFSHVQKYGLDGVADLVLEACLHDQTYDSQAEPSRAKWLFEMFQGTAEYSRISETICSALASETEAWDLRQLCEIAAYMSASGDEKAHSALRSRVLQQASGSDDIWVGADDLVRVDGGGALIELARCYGNQLIKDPDTDIPSLEQLFDDSVPDEARTALKEISAIDPSIKAYWDAIIHYEAGRDEALNTNEKIRERTRERFPLQKILNDAAAAFGEYPGQYLSFGRAATPDELEIIFQRLLIEANEQVVIRLLWVFRRTEMPRLDPKIWQFAASTNKQLRDAAIEALAQHHDESVGEFARKALRNGDFNETESEVLDLFIHNYQPEDGELIVTALQSVSTTSEFVHDIGWSILNICDKNSAPELSKALNWVYETTPCSNCRGRAVKHLLILKAISPEKLEECKYDANEDIREYCE
jgi:hypothetical protein